MRLHGGGQMLCGCFEISPVQGQVAGFKVLSIAQIDILDIIWQDTDQRSEMFVILVDVKRIFNLLIFVIGFMLPNFNFHWVIYNVFGFRDFPGLQLLLKGVF